VARIAAVAGLAATAAFFVTWPLVAAEVPSVSGAVPHQQAAQPPAQVPPTQVTPSRPTTGGFGSPWDWWSDPAVKKDLKLTEDQIRKIRDIFEKREVEVKPLGDMLNREADRLDRMTRERVADESTYAVQVSKVQHLFARLRESRTVMIYRMYRELQPEQYKKLQEIMDRRRAAMDGRGSGPR
jgi:Spy/CpxP family protein refolding chaperone